jgi:hypothetical protein
VVEGVTVEEAVEVAEANDHGFFKIKNGLLTAERFLFIAQELTLKKGYR